MSGTALLDKFYSLIETKNKDLTDKVVHILVKRLLKKWFFYYENEFTDGPNLEIVFLEILNYFEYYEMFEDCHNMMEKHKQITFKQIKLP